MGNEGFDGNTLQISWLHRASNNVETFSLPTDAHNVKKHRVIKTF